MSYSESREVLTGTQPMFPEPRTAFLHAVLLNGRLAGHWRYGRDNRGRPASIETQLGRRLTADETAAVQAEVVRFSHFVASEVTWRDLDG